MGNKCWGTFSTVELMLSSYKWLTLNQVIKITIHVQFVPSVKTFLMKKNFRYWNIKNIITLQESVNHIMMNNQTETSSPMPNQDITWPIDLSNPTKPASAIRADAVRGVN